MDVWRVFGCFNSPEGLQYFDDFGALRGGEGGGEHYVCMCRVYFDSPLHLFVMEKKKKKKRLELVHAPSCVLFGRGCVVVSLLTLHSFLPCEGGRRSSRFLHNYMPIFSRHFDLFDHLSLGFPLSTTCSSFTFFLFSSHTLLIDGLYMESTTFSYSLRDP
jgi:hypothetical protein